MLYQSASRSLDQPTLSKLIGGPPGLFTMPGRSGALRIADASRSSWVLESATGLRAELRVTSVFGRASFFVLGNRLDPGRLPPVAPRGVAVPVTYGPSRRKAVLLAGYVRRLGTWRLYGYLPGFSLPPQTAARTTLERPLVSPDGILYRVDSQHRRLVEVGRFERKRDAAPFPRPGCSSWPQPSGDRYLACPGSITRARGGARVTLVKGGHLAGGWGFLAPSPDGRTLLLEDDEFGCGIYSRAAFLSTRGGGGLQFPIPQSSDSAIESQPLGWLQDGSALLAVQNNEGCEGQLKSGIYEAWPGETRPPQLVLETSGGDATTWASAPEVRR